MGRVIRNHGLDGALRIKCHSDNPQRFQAGNSVTVGDAERAIVSCQSLPGEYAILRLDGIVDVQTAQLLAGQWLYAATDSGPELPPGEYYHYQLVGLQVTTDEGENLPRSPDPGSNDVYVVGEGAEILLPAVVVSKSTSPPDKCWYTSSTACANPEPNPTIRDLGVN